MSDLRSLGEFGLIDRLERVLQSHPASPATGEVVHGIGDDAAVLRLPPETDVVTTIDALIEGVHFRRDWSQPEDVGWKALAANVSDIGAMGGRPLAAFVGLGVPPDTPVGWIERFYAGLAECGAEYGCPVAGGDTVRSPECVAISITVLGAVSRGHVVRRCGARVGDVICVTGVLGDSGGGLTLLQQGKARSRKYAALLDWHRRPRPPVAAGSLLAEAGVATSMMDLSDGLASDLRHIVRESGVGAWVEAERIPISDAARRAAQELGVDPLFWALHGGEDYQLLFTVPPERFAEVPPLLGPLGVTATRIGVVEERSGTWIEVQGKEHPLRPEGFTHFSGE